MSSSSSLGMPPLVLTDKPNLIDLKSFRSCVATAAALLLPVSGHYCDNNIVGSHASEGISVLLATCREALVHLIQHGLDWCEFDAHGADACDSVPVMSETTKMVIYCVMVGDNRQ
ncbi:uncharacterized protein PAC_03442 [Phialocephala subalpina]|uniref:Uncharacterized protein n=1 Tax=Phialocephala subalpina TaxID=576137 RepID=A0A1L7WLE1_9HELO|nr:uncharacterized protein PAC_03442 [Phialocephala subalpina]